MIDVSHQIFTRIASALRDVRPEVKVVGEYLKTPAQFPCVTVDEISNLPARPDSGTEERYSTVTYRVQVFALREAGGRDQARALLEAVNQVLSALNFTRKSMTTGPELYHAQFYSITATYEAVIGRDGCCYRTR